MFARRQEIDAELSKLETCNSDLTDYKSKAQTADKIQKNNDILLAVERTGRISAKADLLECKKKIEEMEIYIEKQRVDKQELQDDYDIYKIAAQGMDDLIIAFDKKYGYWRP